MEAGAEVEAGAEAGAEAVRGEEMGRGEVAEAVVGAVAATEGRVGMCIWMTI